MNDQSPLPRFRKPPVSEVAIGVQFQTPSLNPVHLGLYYERIKTRFRVVTVQPPMQSAFETFGSAPMAAFQVNIPFPVMGGVGLMQPRMWFGSEDGASLIQLQSGRLIFNWRGGLKHNAYPHFNAVQAEFGKALDELEALAASEGLGDVSVNQCELVYVNPLPVSDTGVPLSEPQRIFRIWSNSHGDEWDDEPEDISFNARFRFNDQNGNPFGRLTVALTPGWSPVDGSPAFQLDMTARGQPLGPGRAGITAFHDHAHLAIVRCFAAMTTPEMHERWERYQ